MACVSLLWDWQPFLRDRRRVSEQLRQEQGLLHAVVVQEDGSLGVLEVGLLDKTGTLPQQLQENQGEI